LIPKEESHARGVRYGYNPNEIRDVARSVSRKATSSGFDVICAEFWMGHTIDPLGYDKLQKLEPEWSAEEYRLVEPYLNIVSNPPSAPAGQDTLTSGLAKLTATGWKVDALSETEREAVYRFFAEKVKPQKPEREIERVATMTVSAGDMNRYIEALNPATRQAAREGKRWKIRRTVRNGGTPVDAPYETRVVTERELVPLLNAGWDIVKELSNGKIVIRRMNGAE
jgi:hypothetical protein